jgi:hypothetical protein
VLLVRVATVLVTEALRDEVRVRVGEAVRVHAFVRLRDNDLVAIHSVFDCAAEVAETVAVRNVRDKVRVGAAVTVREAVSVVAGRLVRVGETVRIVRDDVRVSRAVGVLDAVRVFARGFACVAVVVRTVRDVVRVRDAVGVCVGAFVRVDVVVGFVPLPVTLAERVSVNTRTTTPSVAEVGMSHNRSFAYTMDPYLPSVLSLTPGGSGTTRYCPVMVSSATMVSAFAGPSQNVLRSTVQDVNFLPTVAFGRPA